MIPLRGKNMTFGTREFKNGKIVGYLIFDSGKKVYLNTKERFEFLEKVEYWKECDRIEEVSKHKTELLRLAKKNINENNIAIRGLFPPTKTEIAFCLKGYNKKTKEIKDLINNL